jgi:Yip1 domain
MTNAVLRAKAMLVDPRAEWAVIEEESGDPAYVLTRYVAVLALIPATCSFIGVCIIGVIVPGAGTVRTPIFDGLFGAIFGYVMSCAIVLVLALIVDVLAPWFGGRRDFDSAFKLAVYSFTPVWLAGVFLLLPGLRFLLLTGLYSAYILSLGLPRLTKSAEPRAQGFVVVIAVAAFALLYAAAAAQRLVFGTPGL